MGSTEEKMKKKILHLLSNESNDDVSKIFLVGVSGIGKTWMAREISKSAIDSSLCYASLWVTVTEEFDTNLLYQSIARQLSLSSITEESEDEEEIAEQKELSVPEIKLKKMLQAKLKEHRCKGKEYLLLVLDDITGNKMKGKREWDQVLQALRVVLPSIDYNRLKLLITIRDIEEGSENTSRQVVKFEPLSSKESLDLLDKSVDNDVKNQVYKRYCRAIADKSMGLPAAITMIAHTLNFINRNGSGTWTLESALEEAANYQKVTDGVNPLVLCAYDMLQGTVLKNCFWYSIAFFRKYGNVHYNELIAHWIIEGYFDRFEHIKEAYEEGHNVLMELLDRGMLKIKEGNIIVLEGAALKIFDCCFHVFTDIKSLRLLTACEKNKRSVLGRITMMDGMIKTLCNPKSWKEVSTLLIDGSHLCHEVLETFFGAMNQLEVVAIFNPWIKSLNLSSFKMKNLLVLVLRHCDLLEEIIHIQNLECLNVLEISGANCLKSIPDELFYGMNNSLQSLNLSGLQIESLPSSFYELRQLRLLILKGCSRLKELQSLKKFRELQTLDLSGASSLRFRQEEGVDNSSNSKKGKHRKLEATTFALPSKVQMIDLSGTEIQQLPKFLSVGKVTKLSPSSHQLARLLLKGCHQFHFLPSLEQFPGLQILDLSECSRFNHFEDTSIENLGKLRVLNLSKTSLIMLPSIPCNLSELNLSGCSELRKLPSTIALKNLELLDVSNTPQLAEIENKSFGHLTSLRSLNLSNTQVKNLTWLSNLTNLSRLFLRDCFLLENLPKMEGLSKLELLDLSGSRGVQSLRLEKLGNLQKLLLSGCSSLQELPSLNSLVRLKVLNISKSGIKELSPEISSLQPAVKVIKKTEEENTQRLPEDVMWEQCSIFKPFETQSNGKKASIVVNGTKNFNLLKDISDLKEVCLKQISFPIKENSGNSDEYMFSDIYFQSKQVPCHEKDAQFLEIRGFNGFPESLKDILKRTEYISLTENAFMNSLSELAADLTKVKGCWLERCLKMNSIFCEKRDVKLSQKLKILWVSNLPNLENLYGDKLKYMNFQSLTLLHLDCCPKLETVFTSSHFPRYLEILQITFCDSLQTVFRQNRSDRPTLSKLHTLLLVGLPKLMIIGASFPYLRSRKTIECPKLLLADFISTRDEAAVSNYQSRKWEHVTSGLTRSMSM